MARSRNELPQGTLDLLVLQIVSLGPLHGYAITKRIQQVSEDLLQIRHGSLYPALHRLEDQGCLSAVWQTSDTGRESKLYRLTPKGRSRLEAETTHWGRLARGVGLVLKAEKEARS
jgi:transcriptional regulator